MQLRSLLDKCQIHFYKYKQFYFKQFSFTYVQFFVYTLLNEETVLFQRIKFSMSSQSSSIWPIDRTLLGATTPGQSGLGSDGNKRVLCIPQNSSITGTSPSDCFVSYAGHSLGKSYPSVEMKSVYSTARADKAKMVTSIAI